MDFIPTMRKLVFLVLNDEYSRKKIKEDTVLKNKTNFIKENMLKIYDGFRFQ